MEIIKVKKLNKAYLNEVLHLWNYEYPATLSYSTPEALADFFKSVGAKQHYLLFELEKVVGWAFTFLRENNPWFSIIVDRDSQKKGLGSTLIKALQADERELNGWVIDSTLYKKLDGTVYRGPLDFYKKIGFTIHPDVRFKNERIDALKIQWTEDRTSYSNIKVKPLDGTAFEQIANCFLLAFANYFVEMPTDIEFWRARWKRSRIDWRYSFGAFENEKLLAFILHSIGQKDGQYIAYNAGTGVIPSHRGRHLVSKLYEVAFCEMKSLELSVITLEVIRENIKAINVYSRLGFRKVEDYEAYQFNILRKPTETTDDIISKLGAIDRLAGEYKKYQPHYSWDYSGESILYSKECFMLYDVYDNTSKIGYFIIGPSDNTIAQLESFRKKHMELVIRSALDHTVLPRIINIPSTRVTLISCLKRNGFDSIIGQYLMSKPL